MKLLNALVQTLGAMNTTLRQGFLSTASTGPARPFRGHPVLRSAACTRCQRCIEACPTQCIQLIEMDGELVLDLDWRRCICCGICADVCPENAVDLGTTITIENKDRSS